MTALEWLAKELESYGDPQFCELEWEQLDSLITQAKELEKQEKLKTKIICWKEALQFIDNNYTAELINIRIYNMEKELKTFKSKE